MKNLRFVLVVVTLALTSIAATAVIRHWNIIPIVRAQTGILPPPQTVELQEFVWRTGTRPALVYERTLAVRTDGSSYQYDRYHRTQRGSGDEIVSTPEISHSQTLLSLQGGIRAEIAHEVKTMSVTKGPNADAWRDGERWDPRTGCTVRFDGHTAAYSARTQEDWLGYESTKLFVDDTSMVVTVWRAPKLGCTELRRLAEFRGPDGHITDVSDLRAVSVIIGEPDSRLWQIPTDFENVPYTEKLRRQVHARGGTVDDRTLALLGPADKVFHEFRYDPR